MWIILNDACGLVCYLFGVSVVLFVDFVTVSEVIWPWLGGSWWGLGLLHALGFQVIIALILASYIKAATTDPGAVARGSASRADLYAPDADALRAYKPRCVRRRRSRRAAVRGGAWRAASRVCSLRATLPRRLPRVRLCVCAALLPAQAPFLRQVRVREAAARAPLLDVRPLHQQDGPPLPVGQQLRRI